jgi:hypothetical protein
MKFAQISVETLGFETMVISLPCEFVAVWIVVASTNFSLQVFTLCSATQLLVALLSLLPSVFTVFPDASEVTMAMAVSLSVVHFCALLVSSITHAVLTAGETAAELSEWSTACTRLQLVVPLLAVTQVFNDPSACVVVVFVLPSAKTVVVTAAPSAKIVAQEMAAVSGFIVQVGPPIVAAAGFTIDDGTCVTIEAPEAFCVVHCVAPVDWVMQVSTSPSALWTVRVVT